MPLSKFKIRWGYLIAFLLLLSSYFLIFYIIGLQITESKQVARSHAIVSNLESIKGAVTDAETGARGYVITKDERFLEPFATGSQNIKPLYESLRLLTRDNETYSIQVNSLGRLIDRRIAFLSLVIQELKADGLKAMDHLITQKENSKNVMDSIRMYVNRMKKNEQSLMEERNSKLAGIFYGTEVITVISLLIALLTIFYSVMIYNAGNKAREAADRKSKEYSLQLEERVAELKRLNVELNEFRSLEKFTSTGRIARTIAHEVRNPLTNISLASEQLKDMFGDRPDAELLLGMISRNTVRINQLVSDLLNSTRFAQLEFEHSDINEILDEALKLAADRIELKKAVILKDYGPDLCEVCVDREKIKLAFLNIIVNSLEAVQDGPAVLNFVTRRKGEQCVVEITDNGTGMDEDTLQKMFDPYFSAKPKGNGLGLTNTQNIVLNHKGKINVRSAPGKGSTFIVSLPLDQAAGQ